MTRAFLYGFSWYTIIASFGAWVLLVQQQSVRPGLTILLSGVAVLAALGVGPLAKYYPPDTSWLLAMESWLIGFVLGYLVFFVGALAFSVLHFAVFE
jgi:hypothetical protein